MRKTTAFQRILVERVQNCYKLNVPKYISILYFGKKSKVTHRQIFRNFSSFFLILTLLYFYTLEFINVDASFWLGGGRRTPRRLELAYS